MFEAPAAQSKPEGNVLQSEINTATTWQHLEWPAHPGSESENVLDVGV